MAASAFRRASLMETTPSWSVLFGVPGAEFSAYPASSAIYDRMQYSKSANDSSSCIITSATTEKSGKISKNNNITNYWQTLLHRCMQKEFQGLHLCASNQW